MEAIMNSVIRRVRPLIGAAVVAAGLVLVASCSPGSGKAGPANSSDANATDGSGAHTGHGGRFQPPPAAALRAGERFANLAMPQPYTPAAPNGGTDEYRCFLIDPKLTSPMFLTGSQFLPQNADIVHHAIFFRVGPADAEKARALDTGTPGQGWTCFGDAGIGGDAAWVASWAPGANETLLAPDLGYPMPPGSQLVMQVHYNLLATAGKPGGADQSGIRLRFADAKAGIHPLQTALLPAPVELPCAAGESGPLCDRATAVADVTHRFGDEIGSAAAKLNQLCNSGKAPIPATTQQCDHKITEAGTIHALAGHMHLLGRSIKVEIDPGTPNAQTLLDVPAYNFDDQAIRPLARPVAVKPGDTYRVTCTHDATLRKLLPQLRPLPPRYVVWGDGTSDEMCLGLVIWSRLP
jgi:hypothetical protein